MALFDVRAFARNAFPSLVADSDWNGDWAGLSPARATIQCWQITVRNAENINGDN
jgi:hypothetical protein